MSTLKRTLTIIAAMALTTTMAAPSAWAAGAKTDSPKKGVIFAQKGEQGNVWVNAYLAHHRLDAAYLPLVIGVKNLAKDSIDLTLGSFTLVMPDGTREPAATVPEVRENYDQLQFDHQWLRNLDVATVLDAWGVHFVPSRFYPPLTMHGGIQIPIVEVPSLFWTADVLYFQRPANLKAGDTVTLEVKGDGWSQPIAVPITL